VSGLGVCVVFGAPARAANPACASPICLTPMKQSIVLMGQTIQSTAQYLPLSIWNMGRGNFDIAFDFPLLPVPVTLAAAQAPPSVAPINLNAVLKAGNVNPDKPGFGGQYGGAAKNWSFVGAAGLQNGTLNVTAYQPYAGPDPVGIFGSKDPTVNPLPEGFAVQVPANLAPTPPKGTALHWVQVIADNYKNPSFGGDLNTGYGKSENIVDVMNTNKTALLRSQLHRRFPELLRRAVARQPSQSRSERLVARAAVSRRGPSGQRERTGRPNDAL
jgi:hypothetical protein